MAWQGLAGHGTAWQGVATHGEATHGEVAPGLGWGLFIYEHNLPV